MSDASAIGQPPYKTLRRILRGSLSRLTTIETETLNHVQELREDIGIYLAWVEAKIAEEDERE